MPPRAPRATPPTRPCTWPTRGTEAARYSAEQWQARARHWERSTRSYIEHEPVKATLIAMGCRRRAGAAGRPAGAGTARPALSPPRLQPMSAAFHTLWRLAAGQPQLPAAHVASYAALVRDEGSVSLQRVLLRGRLQALALAGVMVGRGAGRCGADAVGRAAPWAPARRAGCSSWCRCCRWAPQPSAFARRNRWGRCPCGRPGSVSWPPTQRCCGVTMDADPARRTSTHRPAMQTEPLQGQTTAPVGDSAERLARSRADIARWLDGHASPPDALRPGLPVQGRAAGTGRCGPSPPLGPDGHRGGHGGRVLTLARPWRWLFRPGCCWPWPRRWCRNWPAAGCIRQCPAWPPGRLRWRPTPTLACRRRLCSEVRWPRSGCAGAVVQPPVMAHLAVSLLPL
jgi:hypothetical protein